MKDFEGTFNDVTMIWELRGDYPDIPYAPGVDYESLVSGDEDPMFLTLPIGKAGAKSDKKYYYDEAWLQEMERQARETRPVGLMGHLPLEQRSTAFPQEAVHWVGVRRVGEMLWGKGYVPPGEARERIRRYKATGKKLATSIDVFAKGVWDSGIDGYRMQADSMRLNQIDIAPADRAGISDLASVPIITREMGGAPDEPENEDKEQKVDKIQIIREMTVEDAELLPKDVRKAILAQVEEPAEVGLVTELRKELGTDDVLTAIREMKTNDEERREEQVAGRVRELVADEEKGIKVEALRGLVTELVQAKNPQTVEEAEAAYAEVTGRESVQEMLKAHVERAGGPPLRTGLQPQNGQAKYFDIPKESE